MARRDLYHDVFREALETDGWIITDDPLDLTVGEVQLYADVGAEKVIAAEKDNQTIAVEIKSFESQSPVSEYHKALGQYENYLLSLEELDPDRELWLAIPEETWNGFFQRPFIQKSVRRNAMNIIVFNVEKEIIEKWIPH